MALRKIINLIIDNSNQEDPDDFTFDFLEENFQSEEDYQYLLGSKTLGDFIDRLIVGSNKFGDCLWANYSNNEKIQSRLTQFDSNKDKTDDFFLKMSDKERDIYLGQNIIKIVIEDTVGPILLCPNCGNKVITKNKEEISEGYTGACILCDEDFYKFELLKSK